MQDTVFSLVSVSENTWRIETDMVRAWFFAGTEKALLVDTTHTHGDLMGVIRSATDLPVMLVNTHSDPDHIACNDQFEKARMHPDEIALYERWAGEHFAAPEPLEEGKIIDLGGRQFEVLHLPGHTPGSIALLDRANRTLVSGDTISANPVFLFGPARDIPVFQKSLQRLKDLSGAFDVIFTSHGPYSVDPSQIENEILCLEECLAGNVPAKEPPFPLPAKMYCAHDAGFYLDL